MGTLVQMNYANFGSVQIDLFDDLVGTTVDNFLGYVNSSSYDGTIIHRVDTGLGVIQGGGFEPSGAGITTNPAIPLQYNRANTRGTISMARQQALDSATSQWFINTVDNTTSLGAANNGGYAVFGWVVGPGMTVVDDIAAVPTFAYDAPFNQVPLVDFTQDDFTNGTDPTTHTVVLSSVQVLNTHPAFQNPYLRGDVDNDGLVKPRDLLQVIDNLLQNGTHDLTGPFDGSRYMDVSGDGKVSPTDLVRLIDDLLAPSQNATPLNALSSDGLMANRSVSSLAVVPEPATCGLAAVALVFFGGLAVRARRRRARRQR